MIYLLIVSLIWAFSFGLIKGNLTGIDSNFVSFLRIVFSFLIFIPFIKFKPVKQKERIKLMLIGAVQFGIMYIAYIYSFSFLKAYEVALFTIFTPLYITFINDILNKKFNKVFFLSALISIIGTAIIMYKGISSTSIKGFIIVQISNISFAFGQVYYKKVMAKIKIKDHNAFGYLYLGALAVTFAASLFTTDFSAITLSANQIFTLIYLGVLSSGICFFLWNYGARKTDTGTLAVFNNLKIPLSIAVSLIFFGESTDIIKLLIGGAVILFALIINRKLA